MGGPYTRRRLRTGAACTQREGFLKGGVGPRNPSRRLGFLGAAALACVTLPLAAENPDPAPAYTLPRTRVLTLKRADDTGVDHVLYLSLPRDYQQTTHSYPVVYLLDPDYSFALAHNIVEHFVDRGDLPPMILVGVGYPGKSQDKVAYRRHRTRDYTPSHTFEGGYGPAFQTLSGGGPAFRDFFAKQLIPWIGKNYRTSDNRALVGHSYGGLFATYVLLTTPDLFDRYLAVSPSYWYDQRLIFRLEQQAAEKLDDLAARVFLSVGELESVSSAPLRGDPPHRRQPMVEDLERLARRLRARNYPRLELATQVFPDENHNSVFPAALTRGLRWLFEE